MQALTRIVLDTIVTRSVERNNTPGRDSPTHWRYGSLSMHDDTPYTPTRRSFNGNS